MVVYCGFHKNSTVYNIDNNKKCYRAANQHIRLITKGSCDTGDWGNDAENNISQYYCSFSQINAALVCIRYFFLNIKIL